MSLLTIETCFVPGAGAQPAVAAVEAAGLAADDAATLAATDGTGVAAVVAAGALLADGLVPAPEQALTSSATTTTGMTNRNVRACLELSTGSTSSAKLGPSTGS
jgi:hypothetical protein